MTRNLRVDEKHFGFKNLLAGEMSDTGPWEGEAVNKTIGVAGKITRDDIDETADLSG